MINNLMENMEEKRNETRARQRIRLLKEFKLELALCLIWSLHTKSHVLGRRLHSGTSTTRAGQGGLVRDALYRKSHSATCVQAYMILHHVTGSRKWTIKTDERNANFATENKIKLNWLSGMKKRHMDDLCSLDNAKH